jgi:hypothetical protein
MNSDVVSLACITQEIQQEPIIFFFEEAKVSIIATLNNMTGYARQIHPWLSWHRNFLLLCQYRFPEFIRYLYYCEGFSCTSDSFNLDGYGLTSQHNYKCRWQRVTIKYECGFQPTVYRGYRQGWNGPASRCMPILHRYRDVTN